MQPTQPNWIASSIRGIADDVLRDLYVRGKYRDVILPMTVLKTLGIGLRRAIEQNDAGNGYLKSRGSTTHVNR